MMKPWTTLALAAAAIALMSCDRKAATQEPPKPQEYSQDVVGHFCGMSLFEHPGPKGQIFVEGKKDPVWFASVRETFAFTMLPEEPKNIAAIYVTDMGKATNWEKPERGTWIDAKRAYYVIGSRRQGGMGVDEAVPFGEEGQAKRFAAENGGRIVAFGAMPEDFILQYGDAEAAGGQGGSDHQQVGKP
jgi:copper chaperone NosL